MLLLHLLAVEEMGPSFLALSQTGLVHRSLEILTETSDIESTFMERICKSLSG